MAEPLKHCNNWVFDLDNTLYPPESDLFAQIDRRMTKFIAQFLDMDLIKARVLQKHYYLNYGTTLNGLMANYQLSPESFLEFVHDIDHSVLDSNPNLEKQILGLEGKKIIFTNGSNDHALSVLAALGLEAAFDEIVGIEDTGYVPKPNQSAYDFLVQTHELDPNETVLFEDLARNLKPAKQMGFSTVLVCSEKDWSHEPEGARPAASGDTHDHVDFSTSDLTGFLSNLSSNGDTK